MTEAQPSHDTSRISISAHYTGYVWYQHQLSADAFATATGRWAYRILTPINAMLKGLAGANIDTFLLQRHLVIDHQVELMIEQHGITQIIELAAGLSPRGYRLSQKYPHLTYIETDLPGMAARKQALLATLTTTPSHRVEACNILQTEGTESLEALFQRLDRNQPTLVISEGLVNYFELPMIRTVWQRLAKQLAECPMGVYVTDLYPDLQEHPSYRYVQWAQKLVGFFTRGQWPLHYRSDKHIEEGFRDDGFTQVAVLNPSQLYDSVGIPRSKTPSLVRIICAQTA